MKKSILPVLSFLPAAVLVFCMNSCGNDNTPKTPVDSSKDTASTQNQGPRIPNDTDYVQVPSPAEMFSFMKAAASNSVGDPNLLNPVDNEKKYDSKKAQSLNLGTYSADLLYCSTFKVNDKVGGYFAVCMHMGDKLQVATNLSDADKQRISKNSGNGDSLISISNDLYLSSFQNLESSDRGADLSLMLAGGWTETLYLMSNMVKDFNKDNAIAQRVADQHLSLDNLVEFLGKYEDKSADVKAVNAQMKDLQTLFSAVSSTANQGGMTVKNGKHVLGGGTKSAMTKDQFQKIKDKITEIRNSFIAAQ